MKNRFVKILAEDKKVDENKKGNVRPSKEEKPSKEIPKGDEEKPSKEMIKDKLKENKPVEKPIVKKDENTLKGFNDNSFFKFNVYFNGSSVKSIQVKGSGLKGIVDYINDVFNKLLSRKAPIVLAKIENGMLNLNPTKPQLSLYDTIANPMDIILGIVKTIKTMKVKIKDPMNLYDFIKGKFNTLAGSILDRNIKTRDGYIYEIEGMKLKDSLPILNEHSKEFNDLSNKLLKDYNSYISLYKKVLIGKIKQAI